MAKSSALLLTISWLSACATQPTTTQTRSDKPYLTEQQAMARSARVSNVSYKLQFNLDGSDTFSAVTDLSFQLTDTQKPLTIDLNQATITRLVINGHPLYPKYNGLFLSLNPLMLNTGLNQIHIEYSRPHSTNGEGLHRFVDPVDGKVYLYSHFEPAAAQQMFPVFDQPDLKATYELSVSAPNDWQVISATRETSIEPQGDRKLWHFPVSPKLSPYNFAMHAGPYHMWQDNSGKYPMRLFARQSVAAQVTPQDWFTYTDAGLRFFDNYFGIAYPFKKYDQVLVPDFLYGAMENAGAITFAEGRFLYNAAMTAEQKQRLAGVIMHEMAHQWFGDLVTMKWWNGLWLNESFASFMGTLATAKATEFDYAWRSFYAGGKQGAYQKDSKVTTHPIEVPVPTTANAFDNIDAITYQKGASVLKQLNYLLGEKVFQKGVQNYLQQYQWQNATLQDFIGSLANAANRNLDQWTQDWLYDAGVNTLQAQFSCSGDRIDSFKLIQKSAETGAKTLREQKVQVALLVKGRHELHLLKKEPVIYQGAETAVPSLIGAQCPDLVYPNYEDWGYVKVALDPRSFATAQSQLAKVTDPFLRSMLWQSLWDGVMSGALPLNDYLDTVFVNLPKEQDYTIAGQVLASLHTSKYWLESMLPLHQNYSERAQRAMAQMSLRLAMETVGNSDMQRRWFDAYISFASDELSLSHLKQLLQGDATLDGISLDQDTRWKIISQLNRYNVKGSEQLLHAEAKADQSDTGEKAAIAAEVIRPDAAIKAQWLRRINDDAAPFPKLRIAMSNIYPAEQAALAQKTAAERLQNLADIDNRKGRVFMRSYAPSLIPRECTHSSVVNLQQAIKDNPNLSTLTMRALQEIAQEEQRCVLVSESMTQ
ncbi:aminopeptidase N [Shewanella avicenniae]|uniref:Aminopeptidase N n=1 Tax=Shewanella avicenniae TaxID=2814294 RepID=A0ABX7QVK9_9GAMM|nr:aminopeptidase N [Shewanella avicenniae]